MEIVSCGVKACFMIEMEATSPSAAGRQNRAPCSKPEAWTMLLVPDKKPANLWQLSGLFSSHKLSATYHG